MHEVLGQGCLWRIPKRESTTAPLQVIPHALSPRRGSLAYACLGRGALLLMHVSPMWFPFGSHGLGSPLSLDLHG